jgi:hypothetical protein
MHVDILEPKNDVTTSVEELGRIIGGLYPEAWDKRKIYYSDKQFDLNINAFATVWLDGVMKVFVVYDRENNPVGFLCGVVMRPLPFKAMVFNVHEHYAKTGEQEQALIDYVVQAVKILGCDELWIHSYGDEKIALGPTWKHANTANIQRYVKVS